MQKDQMQSVFACAVSFDVDRHVSGRNAEEFQIRLNSGRLEDRSEYSGKSVFLKEWSDEADCSALYDLRLCSGGTDDGPVVLRLKYGVGTAAELSPEQLFPRQGKFQFRDLRLP